MYEIFQAYITITYVQASHASIHKYI